MVVLGHSWQWGLGNRPESDPGQVTEFLRCCHRLLPAHRGSSEKEQVREETLNPNIGHQNSVVCAWVGKEFPNIRQNERRIKFIRGRHC